MQKTNLVIVAIIIVLAVGMFFFFNSRKQVAPGEQTKAASQEPSVTIHITEEGFSPSEVTVKQGETVEWVNNTSAPRWPASNLHPTHEIYPEFDPMEPVESGKTWSFTFAKAGSWSYHDHLAPNKRGIIEVE
jgi:plastocyanin